jgi:hypothetical protein
MVIAAIVDTSTTAKIRASRSASELTVSAL